MNKFNRKLFLSLSVIPVLISSFILNINATEVIKLSEYRIDRFKREIKASEKKRENARYATAFGVIGAGLTALYFYLNEKEATPEVKALKESVKDLHKKAWKEKQSDIDEQKKDNLPYYKRLYNYAKDNLNYMKTTYFLQDVSHFSLNWIVKPFIVKKAFDVMNFKIPKSLNYGEYLMASHNNSWFIEERTTLKTVLANLMESLDKEDNQKEVDSLLSIFIIQAEKVLAFMSHIQDFLDTTNDGFYIEQAKDIISKIKITCNKLSSGLSNQEIKDNLVLYVDQIMKFTHVERQAGFEFDTCSSQEELQAILERKNYNILGILKLIVDEKLKKKIHDNIKLKQEAKNKKLENEKLRLELALERQRNPND